MTEMKNLISVFDIKLKSNVYDISTKVKTIINRDLH